MSDKPILFSAPMIRAILAGTKTQTRRVLKTPRGCPKDYVYTPGALVDPAMGWWQNPESDRVGWSSAFPYSPGDRLWVREAWSPEHKWTGTKPREIPNGDDVWYWADGNPPEGDWAKPKPSIHMPRWASRITLEVTGVRVERLNQISEEDAVAEGIVAAPGGMWSGAEGQAGTTPKAAYALLWDHINGPGAWDANPFVVAVEFRRAAQ
jgi:hypothetical protein